jgi:hypothetical protein
MSAESTKRGIRWRIIPAWFLYAFGGVLCLGPLLRIPFLLIRPELFHTAGFFRDFVQAILFAVAGGLWIVAGRKILNGQWWRMLLFLVLGYATGVIAAEFFAPAN